MSTVYYWRGDLRRRRSKTLSALRAIGQEFEEFEEFKGVAGVQESGRLSSHAPA
jgi:hypothetical protein